MFKGHFIALQKAPFRHAKWAISGCNIVLFGPWNGLYCMMKWAISEHGMNFFGLWHRVYQKTLRTGIVVIWWYLTFIHTSFGKIFCQNKVKKNCKLTVRFVLKYIGSRRQKNYEKPFSILWKRPVGCGSTNSSLCEPHTITLYNRSAPYINVPLSYSHSWMKSFTTAFPSSMKTHLWIWGNNTTDTRKHASGRQETRLRTHGNNHTKKMTAGT